MAVYRRALIKCGETVWLRMEDGSLHDMGGLRGDELVRYAVEGRLPILRSVADVASFDGRLMHRASCELVRKRQC